MFVNIKELEPLKFSSCNGCNDSCCKSNRVSLAPLVLDDFEEVYEHFAILFANVIGELKPVVVLNNGVEDCAYLVDNRCQIYTSRPPACVMYPMSPYFDDFYVDLSCPAVGDMGIDLCNSSWFNPRFYHKRVEGLVDKIKETYSFTSKIADNLVHQTTIKNIELFSFHGSFTNPHLQMHRDSLKHLKPIV